METKRGKGLILLTLFFLFLMAPSGGMALTNEENFAHFQFNYNTPGARAVGMGAAFISVADDATAAVANPAGLTILERPEVSAEVKVISSKTDIPYSNVDYFDANSAVVYREIDETIVSPSFFSFVYPLEKVAFSIYRHELLRFKQEYYTDGASPLGEWIRLYPIDTLTEMDITNVGLSAAYKFNNMFALGASVNFSRFDIDSRLSRYDYYYLEDYFLPADLSDNNRISFANVNDSETENSYSIGLIWQPHDKLSLGAVYRSGPKFETVKYDTWDYQDQYGDWQQYTGFTDFTFKVPDSYGLGISYQPKDELTLSLDVIRIEYSDLLDGFNVPDYSDYSRSDYKVDDGTEIHIGAEYILIIKNMPLALRLGGYYDPDHRIRYTGDDPYEKLLFPEGDDQYHITFGTGLVPTDNFQIDLAGNVSEDVTEFIASCVFRF